MLARPETRRCIECSLPYGATGFWCYHGDIDNGPAYWSDRGILCSPKCSLAHFRKREADGSLPDRPAPDPPSCRADSAVQQHFINRNRQE